MPPTLYIFHLRTFSRGLNNTYLVLLRALLYPLSKAPLTKSFIARRLSLASIAQSIGIIILALTYIPQVLAQTAGSTSEPQPSTLEMLALPLAFFLLMYIILIRPQARKYKEQKQFLSELQVGHKVVTTGGLLAHITWIEDHHVGLDIGPGEVTALKEHVLPFNSVKTVPGTAQDDHPTDKPALDKSALNNKSSSQESKAG